MRHSFSDMIGVGNRYRQTATYHYWKVNKIISNIAALPGPAIQRGAYLFKSGQLVLLPRIEMCDTELFYTRVERWRGPRSDQANS